MASQSLNAPMAQNYREVNGPRKLIHTSRKTMMASTCQSREGGLLFPPRRRGNPTTAANSAGNRRTGRTGEPACRQEGQPEVCGKLQAEGSVEVPDGDPLGDRRAGNDHGKSRDLPRRTERSVTGRSRGQPGDQVVRPTPVIRKNHAAVGHCFCCDPDGVGSPARHRTD
jgi:hypothetical protein